MKKTLSLILAAVVVLSALVVLASCGAKGEGIVGTWKANISFDKMMAEEEGAAEQYEALGIDLKGKSVDLKLEIREDGTYTRSIDPEQMKSVMTDLFKAMIPAMAEMMGSSVDDYLSMMGVSSIEEAAEKMLEEEGTDDTTVNGKYTYEEGKLTLDETVATVELKGDDLTVKECDNDEIFPAAALPLAFERQ